MTTTAARAAFIREQFRTVKSGPDSAVLAKYGDSARRSKESVPTFFEVQADAQAMCNERMALLSADRHRFTQDVSGEQTGLSLTYVSGAPTVTVIDDERAAAHNAVISEISIDFTNETTKIESWG